MKVARLAAVDEPLPDPWEMLLNTVDAERADRGQQRAQMAANRLGIREWVDRVPEQRGPLDLVRYAFQIEPLYSEAAATDREQVHRKATQTGWSTGAIRLALFWADVYAWSVLYTFPTDIELRDFSRKRIQPVIRASEHLRGRMLSDQVDNVGQKQIGQGWISFRGLSRPVDSIDVDAMLIDEYDTSDPAVLTDTEYRMSGAESADVVRRIGVPSIPGYGIDKHYEDSDQRHWTVRCAACNHWNPMNGYESFCQNVDLDAAALVCAACRRMIDVRGDGLRSPAEWVAAYPDRAVRGYHAPKHLVPGRKVLERLIRNSKRTRPDEVEAFHRRDMGEAYAPAEGRLSLEAVRACVRPELRPEQAVVSHALKTMGVDVASARACNVTIEESLDDEHAIGRKVFVGTVGGTANDVFRELCRLMEVFGVHMCCIDNEPDGMFSRAFAARFPGRVYRADFFTPAPGARKEADVWNVLDDEQFVSLWRTRLYDATFERYRLQRVLLPPLDFIDPDFPTHLGNLYRRKVEIQAAAGKRRGVQASTDMGTGRFRVDYVRTGPEDYAQCEAYNVAAIELYWRRVGREQLLGGGPVPLAEHSEAFLPGDDDEGRSGLEYRPGFE